MENPILLNTVLNRLSLVALVAALILVGVTVTVWRSSIDASDAQASAPAVIVPDFTLTERRGLQAYETTCAPCHGVNAIGTDRGPPFLHRVYHPNHHADGAFFLAVRNGVRRHHWLFGDMPPQPQVTDSEVSAIVAYLRALQRANGYAP